MARIDKSRGVYFMSLGLKRGTVQLELHDKQWDETAVQTIKTLKSILGESELTFKTLYVHAL